MTTMTTFKDFTLLSPTIQATLESLGFTTPTDIQNKSIPFLLENKQSDFHGQAQTGTGKTLAFGLPLLHRIELDKRQTQALIVAPTRELAQQICDSIAPFARALGVSIEAIYGGASMDEQIRNLRRGSHIVIGTPGRLNDHIRRKTLNLSNIKTLVLDEADIMLDMGFKEEVDEILRHAPEGREIWLFSATVKAGISKIMHEHMKNTTSVRAVKNTTDSSVIKQYFCIVPSRVRIQALCRFIENAPEFYGFIFCPTKILTSEIAEQLIRRGYHVGALHGDLSQSQRNLTIKKFKNKEISIVVATDVAARGIDIANISHVINYTLPEDQESYVHRIGRTGRAGKEGTAITFINRSEVRLIDMIQRKFRLEISPIEVPSRETMIKSRLAQAQTQLQTIVADEHIINPALQEMIDQYSVEDIKKILAKTLSDTYLASIAAEEDFSSTHRDYEHAQSRGGERMGSRRGGSEDRGFRSNAGNGNIQEFCLSVGSEDGIGTDDVISYITQSGVVNRDQIHKIRVIKRKTFIETDRNLARPLIDALSKKTLNGQRVRLQTVEAPAEDRGGRDFRRPSFSRRSY